MAKISVIVPIYGVEKYLRECLDSIVNQSLEDLEIILIDDGGKDNCPKIIDEYTSRDNRIIAIHKENGGYGQTCNVGLDRASGEYISIIEPDDYIKSDMYKEMYSKAIELDVDIIKTPYIQNYMGDETPKSQMIMPNHEEFIKPEGVFTLKENPTFMHIHPSIWSCLYKRDFLNKNNIRFIEAPGAGWTDNPFQVQTMCLAKRIYYYDKPFYYWRVLNWNDLKDYRIPFLRTKEIHDWLRKNEISDIGILSYLCKREITYFEMIFRIIKFKDLKIFQTLFKEYYQYLPTSVKEGNILTKKNKKFLKKLEKHIFLTGLKYKINSYRKKFISIHYNKQHKYFSILGNYVLGGKYD